MSPGNMLDADFLEDPSDIHLDFPFFDGLELYPDCSSLDPSLGAELEKRDPPALDGDDMFLDSIISGLFGDERDTFLGDADAVGLFELGVDLDLPPTDADLVERIFAEAVLPEEVQDLGEPVTVGDERNRRRRRLLYDRVAAVESPRKVGVEETNKQPSEEKFFGCPIADCPKGYSKASHLRAHLRRHSGEKPFVCNWPSCPWRFSRSDELARHKRSHSGVRPYPCELCEKAFARSDHLAKHRRVHKKKMSQFGSYHIKRRGRVD